MLKKIKAFLNKAIFSMQVEPIKAKPETIVWHFPAPKPKRKRKLVAKKATAKKLTAVKTTTKTKKSK